MAEESRMLSLRLAAPLWVSNPGETGDSSAETNRHRKMSKVFLGRGMSVCFFGILMQ